MREIKMFEGVKVVTDKGTKFYRDCEVLNIITCEDKNFKSELIRALIIAFPNYVDLSEFTDEYEILKLRIVSCNECKLQTVPWEEIK